MIFFNDGKRGSIGSSVLAISDRCYDFLKFGEKNGIFTQNKDKLCKILIITLVFEKNANIFAKNWQKSQKIVIITPTPGTIKFKATVHHRPSAVLRPSEDV
jgi:hypothetical protein